jgi:hypothetical protein
MALEVQPPDGRKRVKVYELRDNDWFDRGTGFCTGQIMGVSWRVARTDVFHRATSPEALMRHRHQHRLIAIHLGGASNIRRIRRPTQPRPASNENRQG